MIKHLDLDSKTLSKLIKSKNIRFGGNIKLKIYGTLDCKLGKRMKPVNRMFFESEEEAKQSGFRPCGHCMKPEYTSWKNGLI